MFIWPEYHLSVSLQFIWSLTILPLTWRVVVFVAMSCPTLCDPTHCSLPGSSLHGISQPRILGWVCHFLFQEIFPTSGSNLCLLHWQADPLPLSYHESPTWRVNIDKWLLLQHPVTCKNPKQLILSNRFVSKFKKFLLTASVWHHLLVLPIP